jgi:hypothetical protein
VDAEALRPRKEVEQTKNRAPLDGLRLQHNIEQLSVAIDIADLRYKLAENELITLIIAVLCRVDRMQTHVVDGKPDSVSDTSLFFGTDWRAVIPFRQVSVVRVPVAFC